MLEFALFQTVLVLVELLVKVRDKPDYFVLLRNSLNLKQLLNHMAEQVYFLKRVNVLLFLKGKVDVFDLLFVLIDLEQSFDLLNAFVNYDILLPQTVELNDQRELKHLSGLVADDLDSLLKHSHSNQTVLVHCQKQVLQVGLGVLLELGEVAHEEQNAQSGVLLLNEGVYLVVVLHIQRLHQVLQLVEVPLDLPGGEVVAHLHLELSVLTSVGDDSELELGD